MDNEIKLSLEELALKSKVAIVTGAGAMDFINGIPIINYLSLLGVKKIILGNMACQWWRKKGYETMAPELYPLSCLKNIEKISETVAFISKDTEVETPLYKGKPPEAIIAEAFNLPTIIISAEKGVTGIINGLNEAIAKLNVDLFIQVDCGSDSLFDGKTGMPLTPLHDFTLLAATSKLNTNSILALTAYACDGELSSEELDQCIANIMKDGGFLGAHGITQKDVKDLEKAYSLVYDPIDSLVIQAAKGELKTYRVMTSRIVKLSPIAAIILFLDPKVVIEHSPAKHLLNTKSIDEIEKILIKLGITPETIYEYFVKIYKD
ncbi:MAG: DUF1152 domain-containing protein [Candidatus Bathyarchaeia archaeon]